MEPITVENLNNVIVFCNKKNDAYYKFKFDKYLTCFIVNSNCDHQVTFDEIYFDVVEKRNVKWCYDTKDFSKFDNLLLEILYLSNNKSEKFYTEGLAGSTIKINKGIFDIKSMKINEINVKRSELNFML